jgi:aryl-alcohol dehydrogenase-like predicted oxidoreductase
MLYRTLGRTGIKVSPYALGALALGTPIGNPDHGYSVGIIRKALQENGPSQGDRRGSAAGGEVEVGLS